MQKRKNEMSVYCCSLSYRTTHEHNSWRTSAAALPYIAGIPISSDECLSLSSAVIGDPAVLGKSDGLSFAKGVPALLSFAATDVTFWLNGGVSLRCGLGLDGCFTPGAGCANKDLLSLLKFSLFSAGPLVCFPANGSAELKFSKELLPFWWTVFGAVVSEAGATGGDFWAGGFLRENPSSRTSPCSWLWKLASVFAKPLTFAFFDFDAHFKPFVFETTSLADGLLS